MNWEKTFNLALGMGPYFGPMRALEKGLTMHHPICLTVFMDLNIYTCASCNVKSVADAQIVIIDINRSSQLLGVHGLVFHNPLSTTQCPVMLQSLI